MFDLMLIVASALTVKDAIKEHRENKKVYRPISNYEAYRQDILAGVPHELRMKKAEAGLYEKEDCTEPHRDPKDGKVVIENSKLYYDDLLNYGSIQTMKWVQQGKYNLTPEEREIELKRLEEESKKRAELAIERSRYKRRIIRV